MNPGSFVFLSDPNPTPQMQVRRGKRCKLEKEKRKRTNKEQGKKEKGKKKRRKKKERQLSKTHNWIKKHKKNKFFFMDLNRVCQTKKHFVLFSSKFKKNS